MNCEKIWSIFFCQFLRCCDQKKLSPSHHFGTMWIELKPLWKANVIGFVLRYCELVNGTFRTRQVVEFFWLPTSTFVHYEADRENPNCEPGRERQQKVKRPPRSLSKISQICRGHAGFRQIFRSFSLYNQNYSPQTIETSDSNQHPLITIANFGQAPSKIKRCLITTKGSRKNNFPCLGAETPVWQGARTAHTPRMERTSNAARRDGSTPKHGKLFLREP